MRRHARRQCERLAQSAAGVNPPPVSPDLLSVALFATGDKAAAERVRRQFRSSDWVNYDLMQRREERAAHVDLALREAEMRKDQAVQAGDDPSKWAAARDAAGRAEQLMRDARDAATRARVAALARTVEMDADAAGVDRRLLDELAGIRGARADDPDGSLTDSAYAAAFRAAGIDVAALPPAKAGSKIHARPPAVALALAAALDDWGAVRRGWRGGRDGAHRLSEVARTADPETLAQPAPPGGRLEG